LGNSYTFWKHENRHGGNGFSESFESWNMLLRSFASWFPDLDWKEIKKKLDGMEGQPLLICSTKTPSGLSHWDALKFVASLL